MTSRKKPSRKKPSRKKVSLEEVLRRDPLSPVNRKKRTFLLGVCAIAITIIETRLSLTSVFGVNVASVDKKSILIILLFIVAYFLIAFCIYAFSELDGWCADIHKACIHKKSRLKTFTHAFHALKWRIIIVFCLRAIFDFVIPLGLSIYTIQLCYSQMFLK